jgi:hypothetical protein
MSGNALAHEVEHSEQKADLVGTRVGMLTERQWSLSMWMERGVIQRI